MEELWKDIPGYETYYQVSNYGRVRSLDRAISNGNGHYKKYGQLVHPIFTKQGHYSVRLAICGIGKTHYIHRLVIETFVRERQVGEAVRHKDGDPHNNRLDNLEFGSWHDNALDNYKHGYKNKLSLNQVNEIRRILAFGETQTTLAKQYGISQAMVSRIKLGVAFSWLKEDGSIDYAIS